MPFPSSADKRSGGLRWWSSDDDERAGHTLMRYALELAESQSTKFREEQYRRQARMYGNAELLGLKPWEYQRRLSETRVTRNVIASCCDTAVAQVAANRPAAQFLTNGADWKERRKAEKLNKFAKGLLGDSATGFYRKAPDGFRDATVFGTGLIKFFTEHDSINCERVFPWDLLVEDADGMYGSPRTITQRAYVAKDVLVAMFPKHEAMITRAQTISDGIADTSDLVAVFESWHLPSAPSRDDGRHAIAIEPGALLVAPWTREKFPFAVIRWEPPIAGFWGRGIAERLQGIQVEINRLLQKVQESFHLGAGMKIALPRSARTPKAHLNNDIGAILEYDGNTPPTILTAPTVHPEVLQHIERLESKAFDEIGISQLSARSEKPAGLNSGIALENYNDIKSDRFVMVGRRWEDFHLDAVRIGLDEAREIRGYSVDVPDRKSKVEVRWADVNMKRDAYVLQCFPTSLLPQTPAGRIQKVADLQELGVLQPDQLMELLDVPDLEEAIDLATSTRRAVRLRIAAMLDESDYRSPEPYLDLRVALDLTRRVYLEEESNGAPEEALDLLRQYANEILVMLQPPPVDQPAAPTGASPIPGPPALAPTAPGPLPIAA